MAPCSKATDGMRFVVMAARTRKEADTVAAAAGPKSNVFAVRPSWSFPAKEWVAADPPILATKLAAKWSLTFRVVPDFHHGC